MNEVKLLNIGGVDQNIKDQYARDAIAPSENGLDSSTNLPVSSRHYDVGEYLIGQTRAYYEVIAEINVGDTIVDGTNVRATTVSDELIALKNQSADTVIEIIADKEDGVLATQSYTVGKYIYWAYGLTAGLYIVTAAISSGDALVSGEGGNIAPANKVCDDIKLLKEELYNINTGFFNQNLFDNPWFTVNQRNFSTTSSRGVYTVDRWAVSYNPDGRSVSYNNGIITISNGIVNFSQYFENDIELKGKTLTFSLLEANGTIRSGTFVFPEKSSTHHTIMTNPYYDVLVNNPATSNAHPVIYIRAKQQLSIKAVKLEKGVISTLKNENEPNYSLETQKCKRYTNVYTGCSLFGYSIDSSSIRFSLPNSIKMKPTPTISFNRSSANVLINGNSIPLNNNNHTCAVLWSSNIDTTIVIQGFSNLTPRQPAILLPNTDSILLTSDL